MGTLLIYTHSLSLHIIQVCWFTAQHHTDGKRRFDGKPKGCSHPLLLLFQGWSSSASSDKMIQQVFLAGGETVWPHRAVSHLVVLKSLRAPPLKAHSPRHLPLAVIKENIVIASTFSSAFAPQSCMQDLASSSWKYFLPLGLFRK